VLLRRTFNARLGLIALLALAVRTAATLHHRHYPVIGDALTFHLDAGWLATGQGFREPFVDAPTAEHPPLFIALLAAYHLLGADGMLAQKLLMGAVGTITVVLVGLLGREVAGPRAGLVAAVMAAGYPLLWLADGSLMSETLYGALVVVALLCALRFARAPSAGRAALLGAVLALATLTRGEAMLLVALLGLALVVPLRRPWRSRAGLLGALAGAFLLVLAPWTIRNAVTFAQPVVVANNANGVWVGANCQATYYGEIVGLWSFPCYGRTPPGDESQRAHEYRRRGLAYLREHSDRMPAVVAARVGRVLDVYRPAQMLAYEASEGRPARSERLGVLLYWLLAPFAAAGGVLLARRGERRTLLVLLAPVAMVIVTAAITYGSTRFRFAAEPSLLVLGAVALDALLRRRFAR
jgi:4-amino-4-deoxy-L-arabinose transferase-like glycosyltransferase